MISIIIPAHNEEQVIGAALNEYVNSAKEGLLEVIVVCNGCTDSTASIARSFGPGIRCLETEIPSKSRALNLGDNAASGYPRFYQDADVVLTLEAVQQVAKSLDTGSFLAAAPAMRMEFGEASWPVRAYYTVWQQLPYVREGMIGVGVYALSEKGRKRFGSFPEIIADDGYIRRIFQPHERTAVNSCVASVRAPLNLQGLLKIKARSRLGGYELGKKFPDLVHNEKKKYGDALLQILSNAALWPQVPVYLLVNLLARIRARSHYRHCGFVGWERDESSRKGGSK